VIEEISSVIKSEEIKFGIFDFDPVVIDVPEFMQTPACGYPLTIKVLGLIKGIKFDSEK